MAITPDQPVALYVGDTLTVRATIRNMSHTGVTYRSSDPEVVDIDTETGFATARSPGSARLAGISAIDPRVFAEIEVTVLPDLPASLTLTELTTPSGDAVDPSAVSATVVATYRVEAGNARRLEVLLGERLMCEEQFTHVAGEPAPEPAQVSCSIDTAGYDEESAIPWFLNGMFPLTARLIGPGDRPLAEAPQVTFNLRNPARLFTKITGERNAVDSSGQTWFGGDLSIEVFPILFESDKAVRRVELRYEAPNGEIHTASASAAPFRFGLSAAEVLAGVTDSTLQVSLSSELEGGGDGPSEETDPLRYDGTPPRPGRLVARAWVGAETRFVETYSTEGEGDDGVGRVSVQFYAGDPALSAEDMVAEGTLVEVGADLSQSGAGSYRLVARVCDALHNCTLLDGYEFGVDLTPPQIEALNLPDRLANPGEDLVARVRDDLSGFPQRMLEVVVEHLDSRPATDTCGPMVESIDLPGRSVAGACVGDTLGAAIPVPRTTAGYYTYTLVAFDRAGNRSEPVRRTFLVDLQPPLAGTVEMDAAVTPGENFSVTVPASDDVELASVEVRLVYRSTGGAEPGVAVPFIPSSPVGEPFDDDLTVGDEVRATSPFVRTLTLANGEGPRNTVLVDSLRATAYDAAGLFASSAMVIRPERYGGDVGTNDPFPRFGVAEVTVDRATVCTAGCEGDDPTGVRISARVEGESGTGRPFARIHFYRRSPSGLLSHLGSLEGTEASITDAGNRSTYLYKFDYQPPTGLTGEFGIVAVGVSSRGNALATSLTAAPVVSFYRR
ncbi:MAG TPA: hypothetical protein VF167_09890 [Longimicrobiaceae bacterium]